MKKEKQVGLLNVNEHAIGSKRPTVRGNFCFFEKKRSSIDSEKRSFRRRCISAPLGH
jgi:hypothetical protein